MSILMDVLMYFAGTATGVLIMCILQLCREDNDK
jgi:hypothetical protein